MQTGCMSHHCGNFERGRSVFDVLKLSRAFLMPRTRITELGATETLICTSLHANNYRILRSESPQYLLNFESWQEVSFILSFWTMLRCTFMLEK